MKNATLIINNPEGFADDIWQYKNDWVESTWQIAIECLADNAQEIYDFLCETEEFGAGCTELYMLGDLINMLRSIEVKKEN